MPHSLPPPNPGNLVLAPCTPRTPLHYVEDLRFLWSARTPECYPSGMSHGPSPPFTLKSFTQKRPAAAFRGPVAPRPATRSPSHPTGNALQPCTRNRSHEKKGSSAAKPTLLIAYRQGQSSERDASSSHPPYDLTILLNARPPPARTAKFAERLSLVGRSSAGPPAWSRSI